MNIYIPVGISGSGKSTYQKKHLLNIKTICPDDLRKKLTGDCSNMSMNDDVWMIAYDELSTCTVKNKDVYFSSTNLSTKAIQRIFDTVYGYAKNKNNIHFKILLMKDSEDEELCRSRVKADLDNHIDRSNTLKLVDDLEGNTLDYDYIHKQHEEFLVIEKDIYAWRAKIVEDFDFADISITEIES